jgi:hypothetical protein
MDFLNLFLNLNKLRIRENLDDNNAVVKVREIDEPKFALTFTSSENSNHCEYHLVVENQMSVISVNNFKST